MLPPGFKGLCVFGDVHGVAAPMANVIERAMLLDYYVVSLGDIIDRGQENAQCMRMSMALVASGRGMVLAGNHDYALLRYIRSIQGRLVGGKKLGTIKGKPQLHATLMEVRKEPDGENLIEEFADFVGRMPMWARFGQYLLAHGAYHWDMDRMEAPVVDSPEGVARVSPTLYGETDGTFTNGLPNRKYDWVHSLGQGTTMVVGHDVRAPYITREIGAWGGEAVFLDTGCGKGGRLSSLFIDRNDLGPLPWEI